MKDIKSMTPRELRALQGKIEHLLLRRAKALLTARQKVAAVARAVGLSVRDLFDGRKRGAEPARKPRKVAKPAKPAKKAEAPKRGPGRPRKNGVDQHAVH